MTKLTKKLEYCYHKECFMIKKPIPLFVKVYTKTSKQKTVSTTESTSIYSYTVKNNVKIFNMGFGGPVLKFWRIKLQENRHVFLLSWISI